MNNDREDRLDRLKDSIETWVGPYAPAETAAMIEAAFLMAAADGTITPREYEQLSATILHVSPAGLGKDEIRAMLDELVAGLQSDGWDQRIAAVTASLADPISRRNAYRLAAGVSFIDGSVQEDEVRLFALLADAFAIPTDEASAILNEVRDYLYPPDGDELTDPIVIERGSQRS